MRWRCAASSCARCSRNASSVAAVTASSAPRSVRFITSVKYACISSPGEKVAPTSGDALMREWVIIVDESSTSGVPLAAATARAPAHDWLTLTGGAIGFGIPCAVGAAVAAPDRPVLCLESDGSAMYTISGLWTMARENLNVTTVIYNNAAYDILRIELQRVGVGSAPGPKRLIFLICRVRQWISSSLPRAWAFRRGGQPLPRTSLTPCARPLPNRVRT